MGTGFSIKAKGREAEILIYEDVGEGWFGGVTAKQFAEDLKAIGAVDTINLRINSLGGDVFDGLAIYRLLVEHKARVVTHIDGWACSIASVIAMAGNEIRMGEASTMMIHNAWGVAVGNADDLRSTADRLEAVSASLRDVYVARTGRDAVEVAAWMDAETWFTAAEAKANGFADEVTENLRMAARFDPAKHKFRNAPAGLTGRPNNDDVRRRLSRMSAVMQRSRCG